MNADRIENKLQAGAAIVDISPPSGVQLVGYPFAVRPNTGVHDPLYAACLYLHDGRTPLVIVCADLVYFEKPYATAVRRRIAERTGVPLPNIMLSASHTHSGPPMADWLDDEGRESGHRLFPEYQETLGGKLVELAAEAVDKAGPARIGFGMGTVGKEHGIGGNRHDPNGLCDPAVRVMGVQDAGKQWLACLVKYSLHPAILQEDSLLVSADYPGDIRACLARTKPGAVVLFGQGSTGDQSSRYFRKGQTFAEAKRFGDAIGKEADRVLDTLTTTDCAVLKAVTAEVTPELRELPSVAEAEAVLDGYRKQMAALKSAKAPYVEVQTCSRDCLGAEYTLRYARYRAEGKPYPPQEAGFPIEIQAFRIGDCCLVGLPGEIFVQYTLDIEKASPFVNTFVLTVTNGFLPGYVVSEEAAAKKLFEAGTSLMTPQTGERIVHSAAELTHRLERTA